MSREPIQKLGSRFPFSREITFPVTVTMNVSALARDIQDSRNLVDYIDAGHADDLIVTIDAPGSSTDALVFELKNAEIDTESYSTAVGSDATVDMTWTGQLSGPQDTVNGFYITEHA